MSENNNRENFREELGAYIRDHEPVSCDDIVRAMRSRGLPCHPNTVRSYLRESGLHVRNVGGRWLWGVWDDQNEQSESPKIESVRPQNERNDQKVQERQETNERMTQERDALWDAVQKSVTLKNEIKSAQERLLMEIAGLIQATYGQNPSASAVPSPRESETKSEVD